MVSSMLLVFSTLLTCSLALESFMLWPLDKRQDVEPGTPLYECHANCGYAILGSETEGYCSNSTFTSELDSCLDCALTYDIWQYYGDQVAAAASACGDNATPSPSSATDTAISTGSATASTAVIATTSSTVSSTTTQSPTATTGISAGISSVTNSASVISSSAAPSQFTGAASSSKANSNWSLLFGLTIIGLL